MRHDEALFPEESRVRSLNHANFAESLHRVNFFRRDVTYELHLAECTATDQLDDIEVIGFHPKIDDFLGEFGV